jgi:hypothetical protein
LKAQVNERADAFYRTSLKSAFLYTVLYIYYMTGGRGGGGGGGGGLLFFSY